MPSSFPGMNPYLEHDDAWRDFRVRFIALVADRLAAQVQPNYIVQIAKHVYVRELPADDLSLAQGRNADLGKPGAELLEPPVQVQLPSLDSESVSFIEIRDRQSRELVCVIELLSPANKRNGPDREQYLSKREQLLGSRAHFVEIDLLRGGKPMPLANRPDCDYSILVSQVEQRPWAGFWPVRLREPLPKIAVPLRHPDAPAEINLQEVLHRLYDAAGYEDYIYDGSPDPSLSQDDTAWARQLISANRS